MRRIRGWSTCRCLFLAFGGGLIPFVAFASIGMVASRIVRQGLSTTQEEMLDIGKNLAYPVDCQNYQPMDT